MILSRENLEQIKRSGIETPGDPIFNLPERILQFGTGVLLRGLPDYFVDKANRIGKFNGRILVVKSTDSGDTNDFNRQDNLYTLSIRGIREGRAVDESSLCSAISRVLSANQHWEEILESAANEKLQIIISNTTEVGIQLKKESIFQKPPVSFPAKLLAFLYRRFKVWKGSSQSGMLIIPTELLSDNGKKLKAILQELAMFNELESGFIQWLVENNSFCSSLVDRIVPGKPDPSTKATLEKAWGYRDELMSVCEPYGLWAIEGDPKIRDILSFHSADKGVVILPDITKYKELKLRMLNATHTLSCGLAYLSGFQTVKTAMDDGVFETYIRNLMMEEIGHSIPYEMPEAEIRKFGIQVLDRFRNPYLEHFWLSITMQYSSKLTMRVLPVLYRFYEKNGKPPELIAMGFAAYILFMRPVKEEAGQYFGILNNQTYSIRDDQAEYFFGIWEDGTIDQIVYKILSNKEIWTCDLTLLDGFALSVTKKLKGFIRHGTMHLISAYSNPVI